MAQGLSCADEVMMHCPTAAAGRAVMAIRMSRWSATTRQTVSG
jgi:hypothetical protein